MLESNRSADLGPETEAAVRRLQARNGLSVDGKLYAIPFQNSTPLVYYNADLLKEAGFDHAPVDWAELIAMATKLTKKTGGNTEVWGLMMPQTYDYCGWLFSAFTMLNGGQYFNPVYGGEVYYDAPSTLGAMRLYDDAGNELPFFIERPAPVANRQRVQQSLRGMFVRPVARIHDRNSKPLRNEFWRSR